MLKASFFAIAALLLAGCGSNGSSSAKPGAVTLELHIGLDGSGSVLSKPAPYGTTGTLADAFCRVTRQMVTILPDSDTAHVRVFRYDRQIASIHNGMAPESSERFQLNLQEAMRQPVAPGTRLAMGLAELAKGVEGAQAPVVAVLLSDGGNDDQRGEAGIELRAAVKRIAEAPRFRALVVGGVPPAARPALEERFAPLGRRVVFADLSEARKEVSRFTEAP